MSTPPRPIPLEWHNAPKRIVSMLPDTDRPAVVCVSGPVGSGKSTLAARLVSLHTDAAVISTDDYLPDYARVPEHRRDEPDASHLDELCEHLGVLTSGASAEIPEWSFHEHRRTGSRLVRPARLIVVEGIHALHATLDRARSLGVLVEASSKTRWARWEILESSGQRGWGVEKARAFFEGVADPTFARYRDDYLTRADALVVNDRGLPGVDHGVATP